MAPPRRPSTLDLFFAKNQNPILFSTFGLQICHYQYIKRTQPAVETARTLATASFTSVPRTLRAGLGWAVLFMGLLTKITLAKRTVREYSDPVAKLAAHRKDRFFGKKSQEGL